jgi:hypothetical protein
MTPRSVVSQLAAALAALWLSLAAPGAAAAVPLKDAVHEYGPDAALAPVHQAFQMALLDNNWIPLTASAREITAETRVRSHYAKVRIAFGDGKATFTLLDSQELDAGACYEADASKGQSVRVESCIHPAYYEWVESIVTALPRAHAKVVLLRAAAGGGKP